METSDVNMSTQDKEEEIIFSNQVLFEVEEKRVYLKNEHRWVDETSTKINGQQININKYASYKGLVKSLWKKLDILQYLDDEGSFETIKKEILIEFLTILYKLERGDRE